MDEIRQKKFAEADEWIQKMNIPAKEKKKIRKAFEKIDSKIEEGKDRDRLEVMLLFYPEIKEQMIKENPEYEKYFVTSMIRIWGRRNFNSGLVFSVLNVALGAKDLATAIGQRNQVEQKRIAKSFLKISEAAEKNQIGRRNWSWSTEGTSGFGVGFWKKTCCKKKSLKE
jgi:hypothetical protein